MNSLWSLSFPLWQFVLRAAVVYISVLILVRLGGKRQVGQMGIGEFVAILLISNAVQNSMNGGDNSITGGIILAAVIIALSVLYAYLTYKSPKLESLLQGSPTVLVRDGRVIRKNLNKELISIHELRTMLRRQGIHDINEIAIARLESDGFISVMRKSEPDVDMNNHNHT